MKTQIQSLFLTLSFLAGIHQAAAQNIYVADTGSGNIYEYTTNGTRSTFASGLTQPLALAFDSAGNLFVSATPDYLQGAIYKYTPDGVSHTFPVSNLEDPVGLAFDSSGNLYVGDGGFNNGIFEIAPNGTQLNFISEESGSYGIGFDSAGDLFSTFDGGNSILEYATNGTQTNFAYGLNITGLAVDSAGNVYVSVNQPNGNIYKFTTNQLQSTFATGLDGPVGMAFDSAGNLYVTCSSGNTIVKITPDGRTQSTFATGLNGPQGIAIDPIPSFSVNIKMFAGVILNNGQIGSNYLIQAISNLSTTNWTTLTNVTLPSNPYIYIDYNSPTNSQQFYRAVEQ
ncbi:MAG TPA: NHL repeat-containing protein [Verrucomicrobiae bacterium]|jgi:sugar lactone lactonase YvrE|nr:NHL repeat-containing protein [Verrucomicrobiae bacterium]